MVTKQLFGTFENSDVYSFEIADGDMRVKIIEYGATIQSLYFDGVDCCIGYDTLEGYINGGSYQGSTVGRYANRIGGAAFTLGGVKYTVGANDNVVNSLHGGFVGFSHRLYKGEKINDNAVKFSIESKDGDGGYPGSLKMSVTFTLKDNALTLEYDAVSDKDTIINPTNHVYFNLGSENIYSTVLCIKADKITPTDELLIPTGEFMDVFGTAFDFTTPKAIGKEINGNEEQIALCGGYDHNFVLGNTKEYRENVISAFCPESNITLCCDTDMPGVQLYTSNVLDEPNGKNAKPLTKHQAFCLETQFFPDTPNKEHFPSCKLGAGEKFYSVTRYRFSK